MVRIPESIQKIVDDYIVKLSKQIPLQKVILFGSYAKGITNKYSDIDLAVFSDYFKDMSRVDGIQFLLLNATDFDVDLEPQPFTMDECIEPVGLVKEILQTGIEIPCNSLQCSAGASSSRSPGVRPFQDSDPSRIRQIVNMG